MHNAISKDIARSMYTVYSICLVVLTPLIQALYQAPASALVERGYERGRSL